MFGFALGLLFLCLHDLDGGVIEHLLPGVVKLPVVGVGEEPLFGQGDGLLGSQVDSAGPLIMGGCRLTLLLATLGSLECLVERPT